MFWVQMDFYPELPYLPNSVHLSNRLQKYPRTMVLGNLKGMSPGSALLLPVLEVGVFRQQLLV